MATDNKKAKKRTILLFFLCMIFASLSAFATVLLLNGLNNKGNGDDNNANPDVSITEVKDDGRKNDGGVSLEYAGYITLETEQNLITLNFTNPSRSTKSLSLEIVGNINGKEITFAKTDIIKPGNKITSVKYTPEKEIAKGRYEGKFIVHFYNEQDQEEIVVTNIDIKVYVK